MIKYQGLSTLEVLKEAKNYNKWIADSILVHMTPPALEIGAGTGNLTTYFLDKKPLYVTDCDKGLVKELAGKFGKGTDITTQVLDITKKPSKKFISFFSTIFAINVLEHIKNDTEALK